MISKENIDGGKSFDWGKTSSDYAKYRDIYPPEFYQRIVDLGLCIKGQTVLDLGTGTGVLPRNMYKYGASFIDADISENQIQEARKISSESGMNIEYITASAEVIDFPNKTFDVITACQCYMYFDKKVALPKIHNALKDGGSFCILWMAWLPDEDDIAAAKRPKLEISELENSLFDVQQSILYDTKIPFTRESWHGRMKACRGIGASSITTE